jgi:hypothetical protein
MRGGEGGEGEGIQVAARLQEEVVHVHESGSSREGAPPCPPPCPCPCPCLSHWEGSADRRDVLARGQGEGVARVQAQGLDELHPHPHPLMRLRGGAAVVRGGGRGGAGARDLEPGQHEGLLALLHAREGGLALLGLGGHQQLHLVQPLTTVANLQYCARKGCVKEETVVACRKEETVVACRKEGQTILYHPLTSSGEARNCTSISSRVAASATAASSAAIFK